jgi:hypothetical protein
MRNKHDKSSLSSSKKRLVEIMQTVGFGRIEELVIRDGEPDFNPPPRIVRMINFGGENGPRPELRHRNFNLKGQVIRLLLQISRLEDGTEVSIEVKYGLPFRMEIENSIRA